MDLRYGPEYDDFRAEVREFLKGWPLQGDEARLPRPEQDAIFRKRGVERGYVYRHIPRAYGGSEQPSDVIKDKIIQEEFYAAQAPGNLLTQGAAMLAPTLLEVGSEAQKQRFVARALAGEEIWCQGYSEPGAGSDLASVQSRAALDGDEWVINGHKIWTSGADRADYMFGLFRTEPDAPKHAGISYLMLDMKTPGVSIRPLTEMTGGELFNEVRFEDVRVPAGNIVGKRGEGWQISRVTLKHERGMIGDPNAMRRLYLGLVKIAGEMKRIDEPGVRRKLAEIEGYLLSLEMTSKRMLSDSARGNLASSALPMMMMKLYGTNLRSRISNCALDLVGEHALVAPAEAEAMMNAPDTTGAWVSRYMGAIAVAIAGGASNIQRNIIGERGLGLPRDLRAESGSKR